MRLLKFGIKKGYKKTVDLLQLIWTKDFRQEHDQHADEGIPPVELLESAEKQHRVGASQDFGRLEVAETGKENTMDTKKDVDEIAAKDLWLQILLGIQGQIQVFIQMRISMSMLLKTLILLMTMTSLLKNRFLSVNTKPNGKTHEKLDNLNENDATEDEASTAATFQNESFPYDPGKTFDTTNDVKEAATDDLDAGKTTPIHFEDLYVHECSGSRNLIQDDLLFKQVAPSVVVCVHCTCAT